MKQDRIVKEQKQEEFYKTSKEKVHTLIISNTNIIHKDPNPRRNQALDS